MKTQFYCGHSDSVVRLTSTGQHETSDLALSPWLLRKDELFMTVLQDRCKYTFLGSVDSGQHISIGTVHIIIHLYFNQDPA